MKNQDAISGFWNRFLTETERDKNLRYFDCFHFDNTQEWADKLLGLVINGTKRATSSSLYFFERRGLRLPRIGDLYIITDWAGTPRCVIETTRVTMLPFRDMTFEICKREGEDESLESWQIGHAPFFTEDGAAEGYSFSWDMPVVFEDFRVVYTE